MCSGWDYSTFAIDGHDINLYTAFAYDAVVTVAKALHELLEDEPAVSDFAFKMMNCALKVMDFALKLMNFALQAGVYRDGAGGYISRPVRCPAPTIRAEALRADD